MPKIAILTDSGSGYNQAQANENGVYVLPLQVIIDNQAYDDGVNLSNEQLIGFLKDKKVPKTSTPTFATILSMFDTIVADGYDVIIAVPLSRSLSSTADYLTQAAIEKNIQIEVLEIYTTMFLQKHITDYVKTLVDQGFMLDQIKSMVQPIIEGTNTLILPNDLNHLKAGGRLTATAASLAALLKIRPILALNKVSNGKIDVIDKVRTDKKALNIAIKTLRKQFQKKNVQVYIGHTDYYEQALEAKTMLIEEGFDEKDILIQEIVAVIACHTGLRCLGIQVIEK